MVTLGWPNCVNWFEFDSKTWQRKHAALCFRWETIEPRRPRNAAPTEASQQRTPFDQLPTHRLRQARQTRSVRQWDSQCDIWKFLSQLIDVVSDLDLVAPNCSIDKFCFAGRKKSNNYNQRLAQRGKSMATRSVVDSSNERLWNE